MKLVFLLIAASIISTAIMDVVSGLFRATGIIAGTPAGLTGKWIESALKGKIYVGDIRTSKGNLVPLQRFLVYHYIIGMILTFVLFGIVVALRLIPVPWWLPITYGFATTLIPLLFMFPAMGFGIFGLNGPAQYLLIRTALLSHLAFGLGLAITFRWIVRIPL